MKMRDTYNALRRVLPALGIASALFAQRAVAHEPEPIEFSEIGIPYAWLVEIDDGESTHIDADHVGAWSWDEDSFPATAKGWTHTSKWIKVDLTQPAALTLTLESQAGVPWPSPAEPDRVAGTNLFPSFTLYRGWDTDAGLIVLTNGATLDQDHTFNNRGNIAWAEDVQYLDHLDNSTAHSATRTWVLPAGHYTINLGGNSPVTLAEGRQGLKATFSTTPAPVALTNAELHDIAFNEVGIPYGIGLAMDASASATTLPDHVGAWSWDEDNFPATAKGWTHTSKWVKLRLLEPAKFTLVLEGREGVAWPSSSDPSRLAGTDLFPSFSIYRGWDLDAGITFDTNGVSIDQDHTFNNRGNIVWAEDVAYLDHFDNSTEHSATRTWVLAAGDYTINLGGNSPVTLAEGRQGYRATFTTTPAPASGATITPVAFNPVGIPYGWELTMNDSAAAQTSPEHVGAWSWDEDGFPATAKGWTHTSKWVKLDLTEPAALTLTLESQAGVPWPSSSDPSRLAGTNLYPSFTIYSGWDTDAGITFDTNGVSIDQDHTFNNRGNIEWAEDVTYLDHLDNSTSHKVTRIWSLPAGHYTINLGGNSPATIAEGRQGYLATFTTTATNGSVLETHSALQAVDASGLSTWSGSAPFSVTGVLLNNPEEFLDATANFLPWSSGANIFRLGGQWQVFVQSTEASDHAGTACWMGQNYGNLPFIHDPEFSYSNDVWTAEIARLEHDPATGRRFRKGDLIRVNANRSLDFAGKRNVNEAHDTAPEADFSIELISAGYGLPAPEMVTLEQLVRPDDGNASTHEDIFDATRTTGGERWQSRRIRINSLSLVDASGWDKTNYSDRVSIATDGAGRLFRLRTPQPPYTLGTAPGGVFDAIGVLDQDSASGLDGTYGYELFVQEVVRDARPALAITKSDGGFIVSWPGSATGFQLYQASTPGGAWTLAPGSTAVSAGRWSQAVSAGGGPQFFRLQR